MDAPEEEVSSDVESLASMAGSFQLRSWPDGRLPNGNGAMGPVHVAALGFS